MDLGKSVSFDVKTVARSKIWYTLINDSLNFHENVSEVIWISVSARASTNVNIEIDGVR